MYTHRRHLGPVLDLSVPSRAGLQERAPYPGGFEARRPVEISPAAAAVPLRRKEQEIRNAREMVNRELKHNVLPEEDEGYSTGDERGRQAIRDVHNQARTHPLNDWHWHGDLQRRGRLCGRPRRRLPPSCVGSLHAPLSFCWHYSRPSTQTRRPLLRGSCHTNF